MNAMKKENRWFLIVDDEPDMCWILEHVLRQEACSVKKATSGKEAMALMKLNKFRMAFVDLKLRDMEGSGIGKAPKGGRSFSQNSYDIRVLLPGRLRRFRKRWQRA